VQAEYSEQCVVSRYRTRHAETQVRPAEAGRNGNADQQAGKRRQTWQRVVKRQVE